jgi:hypothetical protein
MQIGLMYGMIGGFYGGVQQKKGFARVNKPFRI